MSTSGFPALLRCTLPEVVLALAALLVLALDSSFLRQTSLAVRSRVAALVAGTGCTVAFLALALGGTLGQLPGGMLVANGVTQALQLTLLVLTVLVILLASSARFTRHVAEYFALLLFATTAMMLLVTAQNLLVIFVTIEFLSLSLYVLTAFDKSSPASAHAGLTYFLFGGMSAAILLFGMSLLYGLAGSLDLAALAPAVKHSAADPLLTVAIVMVLTGFGFKIAAAPFHMWAPEVYAGAPAPSAALIASGSKVAGFYALFVTFNAGLSGAAGNAAWGHLALGWAPLVALVATVSMLWGNLAALAQTSARRLVACSAIGHAGYMLVALVAHNQPGEAAMAYYVVTYAAATLGTFAALSALEEAGIHRITDFAGLAQRAPGLCFCLLIFLLSLAGVPPLAGFFGKFYVFAAALQGADHLGLLWLVLLALATSVVSFFYYLQVLKQAYVYSAAAGQGTIYIPRLTRLVLWLTATLVVATGCLPEWWLHRFATEIAALATR